MSFLSLFFFWAIGEGDSGRGVFVSFHLRWVIIWNLLVTSILKSWLGYYILCSFYGCHAFHWQRTNDRYVPYQLVKTENAKETNTAIAVVWSLCCVWLFNDPMGVACQAPLSMGFTRQEYWSGLSFPSPGDHSDPGIEPEVEPTFLRFLHGQVDSLSLIHQGSPWKLRDTA